MREKIFAISSETLYQSDFRDSYTATNFDQFVTKFIEIFCNKS